MSLRATGGSLQIPAMPSGTEIVSYHTYAKAQAAVNFLSDKEFDVRSVIIVGIGLHLVGRVIGRLTMAKAVPSGVSPSALWGTFMGLMMSFVSANQSAFLWVLLGITGGALMGISMSGPLYVMTGGRRDFTSQSQVVASRYAVLTSAGVDQTFEFLQRSSGNQVRPRSAHRRPESKESSKHGSRPDEEPRLGI